MKVTLGIAGLMLAALALSGCGSFNLPGRAATAEVVLPFKTRLAVSGENRRDFTVQVENRGAGLAQVRESVRFEGTRHCLQAQGSSDIDWALDPATGDWAYAATGSGLEFRGRCRA